MTNAGPTGRPASRTLTSRTARGYAFMLLQTVGAQATNFVGHILLGWLLFEEDFGLFALTQTVGMAAGMLRRIGLPTIIIRRYRRYHLWANPAVWMTGVLGVASGLLLVALAPAGAAMYGRPELTGLILVYATAFPLIALGAVPEAELRADLRFRLLAGVQFGFSVGIIAMTVLLAWLGFGAYAFVIPRPIMRGIQLVVLWWAARPPVKQRPELRRWRYMLTDAAKLSAANFAQFVQSQSDYVILGLLHTEATVGAYFYAFGLSQRAMVALTLNLRQVLLPALSSIQTEPGRQTAAFLRASRLLAIIGLPACFLQAALAEPAFNALLPEGKWVESIPVLQVLSIGMAFSMVASPAQALLSAQGRFGTQLRLSLALAGLFLLTVTAGGLLGHVSPAGGAITVAIAVSLFMALSAPVQLWVAVRAGGARPGDLVRVFAAPLPVAAAAVGAAWWLVRQLPEMPYRAWVLLILTPIAAVLLYVPAIGVAAPTDARDLRERIRDLLRRGRRVSSATPPPPSA